MSPGLRLQRKRGQIRTGKVENSIEPTAQITWINARLRMIPVVGLQPLTRPPKSAEMALEAASEGINHQRAEILGASRNPIDGELAATQLPGHLHQPGHIQSGGLNPAAKVSADPPLSSELNCTLLWLQPTAGLETPRRDTSLQLDPFQTNPMELRVIQMQITDQLQRCQSQDAFATETSLQWT